MLAIENPATFHMTRGEYGHTKREEKY